MTHEEYESKSQAKRVEILKAEEKQMTHEELLKKIDLSYIDVPADYGQMNGYYALRAVVELHKQSGGGSNFCYACSFELEIPYPCPTIQAIEKELR